MAPASSASRDAKGRKKPVVFDSSFLMAVVERPTPWREDISEVVGSYTPVLLASVKGELSRLAGERDKRGRFAALALALVEQTGFSLEEDGGGKPDDEIFSFALREGAAVATIDSELAKALRAARVSPVLTLGGGRVSA